MLQSIGSNTSKYSQMTQKIYETTRKEQDSKLAKIQERAFSNDPSLKKSESSEVIRALGLYIHRQLIQNIAIQIPNLGIFSLIQNYINNEPVFFLQKDFIKGIEIQSGLFTDQGQIRILSNKIQQGNIRVKKVNFVELCQLVNNNTDNNIQLQDKDYLKSQLENLIRTLQQQYIENQSVYFDIPAVGVLIIKNNKSCVRFIPQLISLIAKNKQFLRNNPDCFNRSAKSIDYQSINSHQKSIGQLPLNRQLLSLYNKSQGQINNNNQQQQQEDQQQQQNIVGNIINNQQNIFANKRYISIEQQNQKNKNLQSGLQKIQDWLRKNNYFPIEGYKQILKHNINNQNKINQIVLETHLNYQQFEFGIKSEIKNLTKSEIEQIIQYIDYENIQQIDSRIWAKQITDENMLLQLLLEPFKIVIEQNGYNLNNTLQILQLNKQKIDLYNLKQSFKNLNSQLTEDKYNKISKIILQGQQQIEYDNLVQKLNYYFESIYDKQIEQDKTFISILQQNNHISVQLQDQLKKLDIKNSSKIDQKQLAEVFKTALNKHFKESEIKQFLQRQIDQSEREINYQILLVKLFEQKDNMQQQLRILAQNILKHMEENNLEVSQLLKKINKQSYCSIEDFCSYLNLQKILPNDVPQSLIKKIDIDNNNIIDIHDIQIFTRRYQYISQQNDNTNKIKLFPQQSIDESKVDKLLQQIRRRLEIKRIKIQDFFKILDRNQDGFLDINEFSDGIKEIVEFDQYSKEGLFSYFDNMQIGLIDQQRFNLVLHKSPGIALNNIEDNFQWQNNVIFKIKQYIEKKNIKSDDLFRLIDTKFEENITINNLREFLSKELKIKQDDLTDVNLQRLYKLIDINKHNMINRMEFNKIYQRLFVNFEQAEIQTSLQFDWKKCAIQQIGIYLVNKHQSIEKSFDIISNSQPVIKFVQFREYLESKQVLSGFNLTDKLMQQLFAYLDKHKKGFLSQQDWVVNFISFDKSGLIFQNFINCLKYNFRSVRQCFKYFIDQQKQLDKLQQQQNIDKQILQLGINSLMPQRFSKNDVDILYQILNNNNSITYEVLDLKIGHLFSNYHQFIKNQSETQSQFSRSQNNFYQTGSYGKSILSTKNQTVFKMTNNINQNLNNHSNFDSVYQDTNGLNNKLENIKTKKQSQLLINDQDPFQNQIIYRIKCIIKGDEDTLINKFKEQDVNNSGLVNNLQFKKVMRFWGFNSKDIDLLFSIVEQFDGLINYQQFIQKLMTKNEDNLIQKRPKNILEKLKTDIIYYMINIKDAFKRFNTDLSGLMKFEEFKNLINYIYQLNGEQQLIFPQIKELFDFIDLRQDGAIDIHEWMQTFKKIQYDQQKFSQKNILKFENDQKNDNFIFIIAKNRKLLFELFEKKKQEQNLVYLEDAVQIIIDLFEKYKIQVDKQYIKQIINFSLVKNNKNLVDFRYLLDVFKTRQTNLQCVLV